MNSAAVIEATTKCAKCGHVVVHALEQKARGYTGQQHCGEKCVLTESEVPADTRLEGFALGDRVEADLWRGGRTDDDGITTGSKLVTKLGRIAGADVIGTYRSLMIYFDDGDLQVMSMDAENGAKPGYPGKAFRRIPV